MFSWLSIRVGAGVSFFGRAAFRARVFFTALFCCPFPDFRDFMQTPKKPTHQQQRSASTPKPP